MGTPYPEGALQKLQATELEILKVVAALCDELDLTWFIEGGTCLGAVRHGGFIPWDDDIDISLPLEDYRLFCEKAPALLPEGYGLYTHAQTPNYPPLFAKVYKKGTRFIGQQMADAGFDEGIFVDVFAYFRLDARGRVAKKQMRIAARWQRMSYLYYTAHPVLPANIPLRPFVSFACVVAHGLTRLFCSPPFIERRFNRIFSMGEGGGDWCNAFYTLWGTYGAETLFPPVQGSFEGEEFPLPHDADAYLTTLYGDYLELPPIEERGAHPPLILDFGDGVNVMETKGTF